MIFNLNNTINDLQRRQVYEEILSIEQRIKKYIDIAYKEEKDLEKDLNELKK